jgi:5-methylcytosine-specific restriction endonuclease McrA
MAKESRRDHRWKKLRLRILARDAYTCHYCGDTANEVDHIVPLKRGGSDDTDNLVACCRSCNIRKKDSSVGVFLARSSTPPVFRKHLSAKQSKPVQNGHTQSKPMADSPFASGNSPDHSGGI